MNDIYSGSVIQILTNTFIRNRMVTSGYCCLIFNIPYNIATI